MQTSRKQLEAEVVALRQEIEAQERQNENIERFIRTADKYVDIEKIDPWVLRELIKVSCVESPDRISTLNMTASALSLWKNLRKRKRRDFGHAVP